MSNIKKYSEAINGSLKADELEKIDTDLAEALLDTTLNEGILKDVPFIGVFIGLLKTGASIKDHLFLKKLVSFLVNLKEVPPQKRMEMIEKIDRSGKYRIKVGEKLLYLIDRCEDHEKAELISEMFKAYIEEKISYDDFLKAARIIENTPTEDLAWFVRGTWMDLDIEEAGECLNWGLVEISQLSIELVNGHTWENPSEDPIIRNSQLKANITHIGIKIREILKL